MQGRNKEGYPDSTANIAIGRVAREERRERNMAKKRSCRRTLDEDRIHEKAVKMRKMTDEQLVHYVEDRVEKARSEGANAVKAAEAPARVINIAGIMEDLAAVKGIGETKLQAIEAILRRRLEA